MDRIKFLMLMCFLCSSAYLFAQKDIGYSIKAHIEGLKEGSQAVMMLSLDSFPYNRSIDSALVKNNEFNIRGIVPEGPRFYTLELKDINGNIRKMFLFISNNENVIINGVENITVIKTEGVGNYMKVDGSPTYRAWRLLEMAIVAYEQNRGVWNRQIQKLNDSVRLDYNSSDNFYRTDELLTYRFYQTFFKDVRPDYEPAIAMMTYKRLYNATNHASFCVDIYNKLSEQYKNSYYGRMLKEKIRLCVGQHFPVFNLPDTDGKAVNSDEFFKKNPVTVIQFWASNSWRIDEMQQELSALYKQYRNSGLSVIGVSSETSAKRWKISREDIPWVHVSDLKGKDGVVGTVYSEAGNPPNNIATTNVIVDRDGKIIAWDVYGPELGWYLSRIFKNKDSLAGK